MEKVTNCNRPIRVYNHWERLLDVSAAHVADHLAAGGDI
jgi:hypothetical protein